MWHLYIPYDLVDYGHRYRIMKGAVHKGPPPIPHKLLVALLRPRPISIKIKE